MNRNALRRTISVALLAVIIAAAVRYVDFGPFLDAKLVTLAQLMVVVLVTVVLRGHLTKVLLVSRDVALHPVEWFGLNVYSSLLNLVLPFRAGISIKGVYLKKVHGLRYAEFVGLQGGMSFLQLVFTLLCGAICLFVIGLRANSALIVSAVVALLVAVSAMLLMIRRLSGDGIYQRALLDAYHSFIGLARDTRNLLKLLLDNTLILILVGLAYYLAAHDVGYEIGFSTALFIVVVINLIGVANLTPGNLGVQEFGAAYVSDVMGGSFDEGFVAMLLIRCVSVACWLLLSPAIGPINRRLSQ